MSSRKQHTQGFRKDYAGGSARRNRENRKDTQDNNSDLQTSLRSADYERTFDSERGRRSHHRNPHKANNSGDSLTSFQRTDHGRTFDSGRRSHHKNPYKEHNNSDSRISLPRPDHERTFASGCRSHHRYTDKSHYNGDTQADHEKSFNREQGRRSAHRHSYKAHCNGHTQTCHENTFDREQGSRRHHGNSFKGIIFRNDSSPETPRTKEDIRKDSSRYLRTVDNERGSRNIYQQPHKNSDFSTHSTRTTFGKRHDSPDFRQDYSNETAETKCNIGTKIEELSKQIDCFKPFGNSLGEENKRHPDETERLESLSLDESIQLDHQCVDDKAKHHLQKQQSDSRLPKKDVSEISAYLNNFIDSFLHKLNELTPSLKWKNINSGSYYEKTKIFKPDEFDVMIYPSHVNVSVDFSDKSMPGFYKVKMISTRVPEIKDSVDKHGFVIPRSFKTTVFVLFDIAIRQMRAGRRIKRKDNSSSSPTFTIDFDPGAGIPHLDIDLVPCFKVEGWPDVARRINPQWIQADNKVNDSMKSYDVVCKACPEDHKEKDLLWRLSFAKTEKMLMTYANSNDEIKFKKNAYKCLKLCIEKVKEKNAGRNFKWSSYNLKHFMFLQYDNWPSKCEEVVIQRNVIKQLIDHLSQSPPVVPNYFIENYNIIRHIPREEIRLIVSGLEEELTKLD